MNLEAPIMTRRQALEEAQVNLSGLVRDLCECGMDADEYDRIKLRKAYEMVALALRNTPQPPEPDTASPINGE